MIFSAGGGGGGGAGTNGVNEISSFWRGGGFGAVEGGTLAGFVSGEMLLKKGHTLH